jgi:hypothetical protein
MVKHLLLSSKARPVHPAGERYPRSFHPSVSLCFLRFLLFNYRIQVESHLINHQTSAIV